MCNYTSTSMFHRGSCTHTQMLSNKKKPPHTGCHSQIGRVQRCDCVWLLVRLRRARWMDRERMTVRKTDKEEERERSDSGELVRCHHSPPSSPGNFSVTSCHHPVTPRPCHPVTYPLSNWACQPIVMRPGSPLTFCFFHTRYREKSRGTGGRAVVSGHAYHHRSQATDINATGAADLWGCVILWPHYPLTPHLLPLSPVTNTGGRMVRSHSRAHTHMQMPLKLKLLFVWVF